MKTIAKKLIRLDFVWTILSWLRLNNIQRLHNARYGALYHRVLERLPEPRYVMHGLFKGLRYNDLASTGSAYLPKLLGTYEQELHPALQELNLEQFDEVLDIGCAEGYYAVGIPFVTSRCHVLAYDIEPNARALCAQMIQQNDLTHRVELREACHPQELLNLDPDRSRLVLSDCEGYEYELLTAEVIQHLKASHFLIELHDVVESPCTQSFLARFENTHRVRLIPSVSEEQKALVYESPWVKTAGEKAVAFAEFRPRWMHWLLAIPNA